MYFKTVCILLILLFNYTIIYGLGILDGHVRLPKVKDNASFGWKEMYEYYVFVFAEGEDTGQSCRSGAVQGQNITGDGWVRFSLPAGKYSAIITEPRFFPRTQVIHDIIVRDDQTTQQDFVFNADYTCFVDGFGDVGGNTYYQTFIASSTSVNRVAIKPAGGSATLTVTFYAGGINGTQIGSPRTVDAKQDADAPISYATGDIPLTPGQLYAIKFESTVSWAPWHAKADVYANGQGYVGTSPYNSDWQIYIGGNSDDTVVSNISRKFTIGRLVSPGWEMVWGQTFIAKGVAIAGVDYFPSIGPGGFITSYVLIRENGPTGRIVAPKKTVMNPTDYIHGASWGPSESMLVPGNVYFVEIGVVNTTHPDFNTNPGMNMWLRDSDDGYADGIAYKNTVAQPDVDLNLTILEYIPGTTGIPVNNGIIQGTIKDLQLQIPVSGAMVELKQSGQTKYTSYTSANGTYYVKATAGIYDVAVSKSGYTSQTKSNVTVTKDQTVTADFNLQSTQPLQTNVLTFNNPGFESGLTGWDQNPVGFNPYSDDTSTAHTGSHAAKITSTTQHDGVHLWQAALPDSITPGELYKFWVWVKTDNVVKATDGHGVAIKIVMFNNAFNTAYSETWVEGPTGTNGWTKLETVVPAPTFAQRVQFAVFLHKATGTVWFDNVNAEPGTSPTDSTPPPVPTLVYPTNNLTTTNQSLTFDWSDVTDAQTPPVSYELQVSTDIQFGVINQTATTSNSSSVISNLSTGIYYWRVRAKDNVSSPNISNWSDTWSVTINVTQPTIDTTPPPVPTLSSPNDGVTLTYSTPTLTWSSVSDVNNQSPPVTYELQVSVDIGFGVINYTATTTNSSSVISNLSSGLYYWRVRARDSASTPNQSNWSSVRTFSINTTPGADTTPPPVPTLIFPTNNLITNDQSLSFDWTDVIDTQSPPVSYEIQVSMDIGFSVINHTATTSNSSVISNLSSGLFYWRVRARDNATIRNISGWSSVWSFTVNRQTPPTNLPTSTKPEGIFVTNLIPAKFGTEAEQVIIYGSNGKIITEFNKTEFTNGQIIWSGKDKTGNYLESGVYIYKAKTSTSEFVYGMLILAK